MIVFSVALQRASLPLFLIAGKANRKKSINCNTQDLAFHDVGEIHGYTYKYSKIISLGIGYYQDKERWLSSEAVARGAGPGKGPRDLYHEIDLLTDPTKWTDGHAESG